MESYFTFPDLIIIEHYCLNNMFLPLNLFLVMDTKSTPLALYLLIIYPFIHIITFCSADEFILPAQLITDSESIISSDQIFRLGFFSPANSTNRYVGVWYNTLPGEKAVVWVANRDNPLKDSSGVLRINADGNLVVLDGKQAIVWTTNISVAAKSLKAELLDSGNLVLREVGSSDGNDSNTGSIIWQSFEHPADTFLKDISFGTNTKTGEKRVITGWKTDSDPSRGSFHIEVEPFNVPQLVLWNGSQRHWRSGPWDGRIFIGIEGMIVNYNNKFDVQDEQGGNVYLSISYSKRPLFLRIVLKPTGQIREYVINEEGERWFNDWTAPDTICHEYGKCGPFGFCDILSSPICSCLRGYEPKSTKEWNDGNWSNGCIRRIPLQCVANKTNGEKAKEDGFLKYGRMKVPDFVNLSLVDGLEMCKQSCLRNCSCTAYLYVRGIGCMLWYGTLLDMEMFSVDGVDLYIRVAHAELEKKKNLKVIIIITVLAGLFIMGLCLCLCLYIGWRWMGKQRGKRNNIKISDSEKQERSDLPVFKYEILAVATDNFCLENKLGEGGFGSVYMGKLVSGEDIAVKRLSKSSGQGAEEFKNEVTVVSGLQHRNLVRLLGFCIEGEEKMLIYEYMPNKSLDAFLFDPKKKELLGWRKCFQIIEGIGRGILYLHRDSILRVIHRDLKPSNILLDKDLNPKIADFGMARIVGEDVLQANTRRVVGTYGYMSPEYAMDGLFSEKSDVYSFGVLILEMITGLRNSGFYNHEESFSLIEHVWRSWNMNTMKAIIDRTISEPAVEAEILRCIQVGLLSVQEFAKDRPTMASIILMLTTEIAILPTPNKPAFTAGREVSSDSSYSSPSTVSRNNVSITTIVGR